MPVPVVRATVTTRELEEGLARIRNEFHVPSDLPAVVVDHAEAAAQAASESFDARRDARDLELLTIDPPGSRDLDQAFGAEATSDGMRIHYAIADVAAFVTVGDVVDQAAHERGVTFYLPDRRAPLYPQVLGEGAASLLPDGDRPALLWTFEVDGDGLPREWHLERAVVRSRRAITYADAEQAIDQGTAERALMLLRDFGRQRQVQERRRGGVSISAPVQDLVRTDDQYHLVYEATLPVERWNAHVSLMTGMCAASMMVEHGIGILRTLPPADDESLRRLRRSAGALGIDWPEEMSYADIVASFEPKDPRYPAFATEALETLRGAAYTVLDGPTPDPPIHSAIGAPYAHVTAPLRRLADRYANEIALALSTDAAPPSWAVDGLPALPELMSTASRHASGAERAVLDLAECLVMNGHVGDRFAGTVIDLDERRATVQLVAPPVLASMDVNGLALGETIDVRVVGVDLNGRRIELEPV